jgi:cyclic pyranopterin phosphate synthase
MNLPEGLADSFGRRIDYLRLSVTERCDLRCAYCHPGRHLDGDSADVLTADDVVAIADAAVRLGIRRIRLTGGEPLLRPDLEAIVARLRQLDGLTDLALTTNARALAQRARPLAEAGLDRVNISLDSLNPHAYAAMTGGGHLEPVLQGLDAALAAGLEPVKVNVVLAGAVSLKPPDLASFVTLVRRKPVHVRFIEAMPVCSQTTYLPAEGVLQQLSQFGVLAHAVAPEGGGPARYFRLDGSQGTLGVITPLSEPFCDRCNRLRVNARGDLLPCLFSPQGISLLPALRGDHPVRDLMALLQQGASAKPSRYGDVASCSGLVAMHVIGG